MVTLSNITVTVAMGFVFVIVVWFKNKKFPSYHSLFNSFLVGGLIYGGIAAIYWGLTGKFLLNDTLDTFRIIVPLAGLGLLGLAYNTYNKLVSKSQATQKTKNKEKQKKVLTK